MAETSRADFDVRRSGDGRFELTGELDMAVIEHLLDAIGPDLDHGQDVTIDLSGLTFLDSSGVSAFVEAGRRAADHHKRVVLSSPSRIALSVLQIVHATEFVGIEITNGRPTNSTQKIVRDAAARASAMRDESDVRIAVSTDSLQRSQDRLEAPDNSDRRSRDRRIERRAASRRFT